MSVDIAKNIEYLVQFALKHNMIEELDVIPCRNAIMDLLKVEEPYDGEIDKVPDRPHEILEGILDYAAQNKIIPDNTTTYRDLLDARIMGLLMPRESEVARKFWSTAQNDSIVKATDDFYRLSQDSNYIRMDRISKNLYWQAETEYGQLEITINLSKPEKDPKEIAAAREAKQSSYPKCLLCLENVGYAGRVNHPARQNHRVIPVTLAQEKWYLQYSPYVYYNEHCIVFYHNHVPMKISDKTFVRLFDFIEQFPHYFIGSNADLPIVGGSILSHEHFQGGRHVFPMEKAGIEKYFVSAVYPDVKVGIVKWPMSVIRLSGEDRYKITHLASKILKSWREYSDESAGILAYTEKDGCRIPHNTLTPIARKNCQGEFELDLVLRNNRTSEEHTLGIFHPHKELHHIKKENIGLIEVMGLAVLPGRLNEEIFQIHSILTGKVPYEQAVKVSENHPLFKHLDWIRTLVNTYGTGIDDDKAMGILRQEVGKKFMSVLLDAGVYKKDKASRDKFTKYMYTLGFKEQ